MLVKQFGSISGIKGAGILFVGGILATLASNVQAQQHALPDNASLQSKQMPGKEFRYYGAQPDTAALRYYARRGEQVRVRAEINRLKNLYPDWQLPENIFSDENIEEKRLWELFSKGELEQVEAEIVRLRTINSNFEPSVELLEKLMEQKLRRKVDKAWSQQKWQDILDLVNANVGLLFSNDLQLIWIVGEAYARLGRSTDALEAFQAAFAEAHTTNERLVTLQKTSELVSSQSAMALLHDSVSDQSRTLPKKMVEDAIIRGYLTRSAQIGEFPPDSLKEGIGDFEKRMFAGDDLEAQMLLAWAYFGREEWKQAYKWFDLVASKSTSPKAVEGAAMSLLNLGEFERARTLTSKWRNSSDKVDALYLRSHATLLHTQDRRNVSAILLKDFSETTASLQSGEGAEALGWLAYNIQQFAAAQAWFSKAIEWEQTETAILGATLTAIGQKDWPRFTSLYKAHAAQYSRINALEFEQTTSRLVVGSIKRKSPGSVRSGSLRIKVSQAYKSKQYTRCLKLSRDLRQYGPLKSDDQQMRGWCLLRLNRPAEAGRAFDISVKLRGKGSQAAAYGKALVALRLGKTNEALKIANAHSLTKNQRKIVNIEILTQRSRAAFSNGDYAAAIYALDQRKKLKRETRDLSLIRAWSSYHIGAHSRAQQQFASLDQQLSTRETRKGLQSAKKAATRNPAQISE